jgi:hypothetical protein
MANHSLITLRKAVTPEDVEQVVARINQRRFRGRLTLVSPEGLTEAWQAARAWCVEAPGTRPKDPGPFKPDEDLGFCFWLRRDGQAIETRHGLDNSWMRWVMYIHEHELARHFGVKRFDGGDGMVPTDPEQFLDSLSDWAARNLTKPLTESDAAYIQKYFTDSIPQGWSSETGR